MRKIICLLVCIVLCTSVLPALDNQQKIYETTSEVYEAIRLLYSNSRPNYI